MTPEWDPIVNVNEPQSARETIQDIRDTFRGANYIRVSMDLQMDEALELLELADQLILTAFRHFGGDQLTQWRDRYAKFIEDTREETNNV